MKAILTGVFLALTTVLLPAQSGIPAVEVSSQSPAAASPVAPAIPPPASGVGTSGPEKLVDSAQVLNNDSQLNSAEADINRLFEAHAKNDAEAGKILDVGIFKRSSGNEVDFAAKHQEMLSRMADITALLSRIRAEISDLAIVRDKVSKINIGASSTVIAQTRLRDACLARCTALNTSYQSQLTSVTEYSRTLNDTLIQDVHRYQLKNSFRSFMGIFWVVGFVGIAAGFGLLVKRGFLVLPQGSSMQIITLVLLLFVVLLFGLCDIMGENGVTGLLAALAGYVLGKTTFEGKDSENASLAALRELNATALEATAARAKAERDLTDARDTFDAAPANPILKQNVADAKAALTTAREAEATAIKAVHDQIERK